MPDARWVRPESLHVTLKFIGEQTAEQVEAAYFGLRSAPASSPVYGGDSGEVVPPGPVGSEEP